MMLAALFLVSSSPFPYAVQTERVRTVLQYPKLTSLCQHFLQTNDALLVPIVLLLVTLLFGTLLLLLASFLRPPLALRLLRMQVLACVSIPALPF